MVKPFEDAVFSTQPGRIVGPVRSQFGWHVIKVHAREAREVKLVDLFIPIQPSSQTRNDIFDRAADFAFVAGDGDFTREAESMGFEVRETSIKEKAAAIPGLGTHELAVRWAFENGVGDVSEPFSISKSVVVFSIVEAKDAGIRPFDEARESLIPAVRRELKVKKAVAVASDYRKKLSEGDSLNVLKKLDPELNIQRAGPIALTASIPGVGRDQNVIGTLSGLTVGQISNPVESVRGAYLIHLLSRTEFDSTMFDSQRAALRDQILQERKGKAFNEWINNLKEVADIEDNRDTFFR
jgi:parvulin-like peptidyl-prolyl isomerase